MEYIPYPRCRELGPLTRTSWRRLHRPLVNALVRIQFVFFTNYTLANQCLDFLRPVAMNPNGEPPLFPLLPDGTRDLQRDRHFVDTWKDMETALKQEPAKVLSIGVANFDQHNLEVLREKCEITPAVNQVELHPYLQQKKLKEYCDGRKIHITAYSP